MNRRWIGLFVAISLLLLGLRFLHPTADFPSPSRWTDDSAPFTDEGWYASAAIHKTLLGQWIIPGDFNPGVVIPAWSAVLALIFHVTGVSIAAARTTDILFGVALTVLATLSFRRHLPSQSGLMLLMLASSPILFVFSRMALLETPMLTFFVAALLVAPSMSKRRILISLSCAVLFVAAVLVKSSAFFLLPALCIYVYAEKVRNGETPRRALIFVASTVSLIMVLFGTYFATVIQPHILDFRLLNHENGLVLKLHSLEKIARLFYRGFTWIDPIFFLLALACIGASFRIPSLRRNPLFLLSTFWTAGYMAFAVLHFNAPPHYFVAFTIPVLYLALLFVSEFKPRQLRFGKIIFAVLLFGTAWNSVIILGQVLKPQYTFQSAGRQIASIISQDRNQKPLVLGHGAIESTLFTRIEAIDDLGTIPLGRKLDLYQPGWILIWSDNTPLLTDPDVTDRYIVVPVASWSIMQRKSRAQLLLYSLRNKHLASDQQAPASAR